MSWFSELAGKAENLLNNLDEQTGAALRNHNIKTSNKYDRKEFKVRTSPPSERGNIRDLRFTRHTPSPERANIYGTKKSSPRPIKKADTKPNYSPTKQNSPTNMLNSVTPVKDVGEICNIKIKKSPSKKSPRYDLNKCPATLVSDVPREPDKCLSIGSKKRRNSLPSDNIDQPNGDWSSKSQNLEIENVLLKNEIYVMNKELSELLDRIRKAEDGNNVVRNKELSKTQLKLENSQLENYKLLFDKEQLVVQMEELSLRVNNMITALDLKQQERQDLDSELVTLRNTNKELEDKIKTLKSEKDEKEKFHVKLENELRHVQNVVKELESELEKSNSECQRLEKDWETYKLRVKSMLNSKDNEIKALQEGLNLTEDTKMLMEQLDSLKEERDELSDAISAVRNELQSLKEYVPQVEARRSAADRRVEALRDALRDERQHAQRARDRVDDLTKELRVVQLETGQTIASLRTALLDKDNELTQLRESNTSVKTTETSSLNVADYDVTEDGHKVQYLTQSLIQKQSTIDKLLAENNMLKIQLHKLECKYKTEITHRKSSHSIVDVSVDGRHRRSNDSSVHFISNRISTVLKRYPAFRLFIFLYMFCLHFWVLTVLFTNTPETYIPKTLKS